MHTDTPRRSALLALPGQGDPFDRYSLACTLVLALHEVEHTLQPSLNASLGLSADALNPLLDECFPGFKALEPHAICDADTGAAAPEESDLRRLLLDHPQAPAQIRTWLTYIIARRALQPGHLWQNLGLDARAELTTLLQRHFPALADQNIHNMRWKKFFYRQLCGQEGIPVCKSPVCGDCPDYAACFCDI